MSMYSNLNLKMHLKHSTLMKRKKITAGTSTGFF